MALRCWYPLQVPSILTGKCDRKPGPFLKPLIRLFRKPLIRLFRLNASARSCRRSSLSVGSASSGNRGGSCSGHGSSIRKPDCRIPGAPHGPVNILINAVVGTLQRVDGRKYDRQVGSFKKYLCPPIGLALQEVQRRQEIASSGKRRPGPGWHDHRRMNRARQGGQRRLVTADPIAGGRGERNFVRRFHLSPSKAIENSFKPAPLADFICNRSGGRRQPLVKLGPAYRVQRRTECDQSEFFMINGCRREQRRLRV